MLEKLEKIYASKDGLYTMIVFKNENTIIILNNVLRKIQTKLDVGPGIKDCGFIFEDDKCHEDMVGHEREEKDKIAYFVTQDKTKQVKFVSIKDQCLVGCFDLEVTDVDLSNRFLYFNEEQEKLTDLEKSG